MRKTLGSLEVAWTQERLTDLKRKAGYGMSWGVEAHLLSADEARSRLPMLSDRILGALYVPSDIQTKATRPAETMAREAERNGATFYSNIKVTGFAIADGRINSGPYHARQHQDGTGSPCYWHLGPKGWRVCRCAHPTVADATSLRRYDTAAGTRRGDRGDIAAVLAPPGRGCVLPAGRRVLRHRLIPARTPLGGCQ